MNKEELEIIINRAIKKHEIRVGIISGIVGSLLLLINFIWLTYLTLCK